MLKFRLWFYYVSYLIVLPYILGVTQEQIDETRLSTEIQMLKDLKVYADEGGDLESTGRVSETPVSESYNALTGVLKPPVNGT